VGSHSKRKPPFGESTGTGWAHLKLIRGARSVTTQATEETIQISGTVILWEEEKARSLPRFPGPEGAMPQPNTTHKQEKTELGDCHLKPENDEERTHLLAHGPDRGR